MRIIIAVALIAIAVFSAAAQEKPWNTSGGPVTVSDLAISTVTPVHIMITCGNGLVDIDTKDGSVKFTDGCTPDEAARNFWKAVARLH